jgi:ribosomal protein S27AE
VASRKSYRCPQCGERFTTEHLNAKRCGHCGAELEREV